MHIRKIARELWITTQDLKQELIKVNFWVNPDDNEIPDHLASWILRVLWVKFKWTKKIKVLNNLEKPVSIIKPEVIEEPKEEDVIVNEDKPHKKSIRERRLEQDLPRRTVEITQEDVQGGETLSEKLNLATEGFSHHGISAIALGQLNVAEKYILPYITYSEREYTNKVAAEADSTICELFPELPRSNTQDLFEINTPYWHESGQYLLIMDNFKKHQGEFFSNNCTIMGNNFEEKPIDERFSVPYDRPMVAQVIHNIGHTYFDMLDIRKQVELALFFQFLDNESAYNGEKIPGHASFLSYYSSLPKGFDIDAVNALTSTDDQFSETFVYHILGYDYKDNDEIFQAKLNAVKKSLELFAKD